MVKEYEQRPCKVHGHRYQHGTTLCLHSSCIEGLITSQKSKAAKAMYGAIQDLGVAEDFQGYLIEKLVKWAGKDKPYWLSTQVIYWHLKKYLGLKATRMLAQDVHLLAQGDELFSSQPSPELVCFVKEVLVIGNDVSPTWTSVAVGSITPFDASKVLGIKAPRYPEELAKYQKTMRRRCYGPA